MRQPRIWEVRDADDNLLRVSTHPVFELSQLQYGQYVRCVVGVSSEDMEQAKRTSGRQR